MRKMLAMNTTPSSLSTSVASTVRAELARRDLRQSDLAAVLGLTQSGMSRRLHCQTPFRLPELELTAGFLGLTLHDLLPTAAAVEPAGVPG